MIKNAYSRFSLKRILEYVWILFIILDCRSVYSVATGKSNIFTLICAAFSMIIVLFTIMTTRMTISKKQCLKLIIIWSIFSLFCLIKGKESIELYLRLLVIFPCCFFCLERTKERIVLLRLFVDIVCALAALSLVLWLTGPVLNIIKPTGKTEVLWGGVKLYTSYFNLFFLRKSTPELFMGLAVYKNIGCFVEPPMYIFCLVLALATELFLLKNKFALRSSILILTVFSTFSTAGYLYAIVIIMMYLFQLKTKAALKVLKIMIIPLVLVLVINVSYMLFQDKLSSADLSGFTHLDDISAGLHCWLDAPLFGHGYETTEFVKYLSPLRISNTGLSNGLFYLLDQGGLFLALPFISAFFLNFYVSVKNKNNLNSTFFLIILGTLWSFTVVPFRIISLFMLSYLMIGGVFERAGLKQSIKVTNNE